MITVMLPIKTVSEANRRDHHHVKAARAREQKSTAYLYTIVALRTSKWPPTVRKLVITITRIGPGKMDSDNLAGSQKAVRDGIAKAIGIDDGDERLTWMYRHAKGKYAVRVEIKAAAC